MSVVRTGAEKKGRDESFELRARLLYLALVCRGRYTMLNHQRRSDGPILTGAGRT